MMGLTLKNVAITYAAIGLLTFGWVSSDPAGCRTRMDGTTLCTEAVINGYGSGMLWPAYWVREAFILIRGGK